MFLKMSKKKLNIRQTATIVVLLAYCHGRERELLLLYAYYFLKLNKYQPVSVARHDQAREGTAERGNNKTAKRRRSAER